MKLEALIKKYDELIRPAGDPWGVTARDNQFIKEFLDDILQPEFRVLDVGCGDCLLSGLLNNKISYWEGVNKGPDFVTSKEQGFNIKEMDFHDLQHPDNSFDLVIGISILEHAFCPPLLLSELFRVSKKYVYLQFPQADIVTGLSYEDNPDHHYLMSVKLWEKMFRIAGFEIVKKGTDGGELQYLLTK